MNHRFHLGYWVPEFLGSQRPTTSRQAGWREGWGWGGRSAEGWAEGEAPVPVG